jgi:lipopolysaccharide O-acetyltransferase
MITGADVYRLAGRVRAKALSLTLGRSFAGFGAGTVVEPPLRLAGERSIVLGAHVYIGAGSWLQVIGDAATGDGPALVVGDGTRMSGLCTISVAVHVELGRSVLLARGVYIADHRHAFAEPGVAVLDQGIEQLAPVRIGDGVWLGEHVVVCPGVTIGAGAVIGANSVVTTDVPPATVAVGAPARVVRPTGPE